MADHALLAPSSAKRWLTCTPSARFEQRFPNTESEAAAEGTLAHSLCEAMLRLYFGIIAVDRFNEIVIEIANNKLYNTEMWSYAEAYRDFCITTVHADSLVFIEQRYDMSRYIPESFGTGDFSSVTPSLRLIEFTDLKYGKGVPVSAIDNDQLKVYALGAYERFGWIYEIDTIRLNIRQPRINNDSTWEISVTDLLEWAETYVRPRAALAFKGEGEFKPGDHCGNTFCSARNECRARKDYLFEIAKLVFKPYNQLSEAEIIEAVEKAGQLSKYATEIAEHALSEAVKGRQWPGWKVVEGKSNRVFVNERHTEEDLLLAGYSDIYTQRELLGITELKKNIGAKAFKEVVEPGLRKPPGKPTLVKVTDARQDFDSAKAVFANAAIQREIK